jgi:hypothetical protein
VHQRPAVFALRGAGRVQCDIKTNFANRFSVSRPCRLVAGDETMRVAVEVLGGELVQLCVLQRFHLVHQPLRNVHALAGGELELLDNLGVG